MKTPPTRWYPLFCSLLLLLETSRLLAAEPTAANVAAFNLYSQSVEARLMQQHRSASGFLTGTPTADAPTPMTDAQLRQLRQGELLIEHLPTPATAGALLHHWRATAFAPGAHAAGFERLMRDFEAYPQHFAPEVVAATAASGLPSGSPAHTTLRIRQHHVITVLMDTSYDVSFGQLDGAHGYSVSRSTRVTELDPRTARALSPDEAHGFLWRLNTYWSYEERDGGLVLQVESVSLSRAIPTGLGWAVKPYAESVPRESLEFTLRSAVKALAEASAAKPTLAAQRTAQ